MIKVEIPMKFPSFNEYVNECRSNKFAAASTKKQLERDIGYFINKLPKFEKPVRINFLWIEANKKRDFDNICYAKKFILDALQKSGKLKNDNRKWVTGFKDDFGYGEEYKVILEIEEVETDV